METLVSPIASDTTFTEFNVRHDVGTPHFVRLYDKATKRLERQLRGLPSVPAAGSAAGGILLGTVELTDQYSINVQDFTPVSCEHRRDGRSSFLTCPAQCFRNAVRRASENSRHNLSIVGYYRTQGPAGYSLEKEDHDIFKKYMSQDPRLLLMVKPYPGSYATGMFYLGLGSLQRRRMN